VARAPFAGESPRVGLALGSGSARGLAHIGVLRALGEAGIAVAGIAGTSIGALMGAVYASGKLDQLEAAVRDLDWKAVASFLDVVFPRSGLIDGKRIAEFVRRHAHSAPIEELPVPFRAVATDLATGEEVVLAAGDLVEAVRASIAVPGILTPVRWKGRILADGALTNPVPVSVARAMGAEIVIAVDLNRGIVAAKNFKRRRVSRANADVAPAARLGGGPYAAAAGWVRRELQGVAGAIPAMRAWFGDDPLPNVFEVLLAAINIMETRITETRLAMDKPDILVRPPLGGMSLMDFDRAGDAITAGYAAMQAELKPLEAVLKARRTG
jgi:NTE family protein